MTATVAGGTPAAGSAAQPGRGQAAGLPTGFVWGAATASYQIEGGVDEGGRGPSIWDTFSHRAGATLHGDTGDIACDHYHRWQQDLDLMAELGLDAYRLSVAWPRLQPTGSGDINPAGVTFYRGLLQGLHDRGITPFVTLYHWDLPQPLEDAGGWPHRTTTDHFADYTRRTVAALGDLVDHWITLNEPWCASFLGYGDGVHAPGRQDVNDAVAAAHNLNLAHGKAVQAIRQADPGAQIGIAHVLTDVLHEVDNLDDRAAAARIDANANRFFLDPLFLGDYGGTVHDTHDRHGLADVVHDGDLETIAGPIDFLGVNHYHQVIAQAIDDDGFLAADTTHAEPAHTALGWSVNPHSLHNVLARVSDEFTDLPLYVTESGAAFEDYVDPNGNVNDLERINYLGGYLDAVAAAADNGANVAGYFVWSLLDNFEWAEGYRKRFGLIYVDYGTQTRIPKASYQWYRDLIASHRDRRAS